MKYHSKFLTPKRKQKFTSITYLSIFTRLRYEGFRFRVSFGRTNSELYYYDISGVTEVSHVFGWRHWRISSHWRRNDLGHHLRVKSRINWIVLVHRTKSGKRNLVWKKGTENFIKGPKGGSSDSRQSHRRYDQGEVVEMKFFLVF